MAAMKRRTRGPMGTKNMAKMPPQRVICRPRLAACSRSVLRASCSLPPMDRSCWGPDGHAAKYLTPVLKRFASRHGGVAIHCPSRSAKACAGHRVMVSGWEAVARDTGRARLSTPQDSGGGWLGRLRRQKRRQARQKRFNLQRNHPVHIDVGFVAVDVAANGQV